MVTCSKFFSTYEPSCLTKSTTCKSNSANMTHKNRFHERNSAYLICIRLIVDTYENNDVITITRVDDPQQSVWKLTKVKESWSYELGILYNDCSFWLHNMPWNLKSYCTTVQCCGPHCSWQFKSRKSVLVHQAAHQNFHPFQPL